MRHMYGCKLGQNIGHNILSIWAHVLDYIGELLRLLYLPDYKDICKEFYHSRLETCFYLILTLSKENGLLRLKLTKLIKKATYMSNALIRQSTPLIANRYPCQANFYVKHLIA